MPEQRRFSEKGLAGCKPLFMLDGFTKILLEESMRTLYNKYGNLLKFVEIGTSVYDSAVVILCGRVVILFSIRRFARNFKNDLDSKMRISYY